MAKQKLRMLLRTEAFFYIILCLTALSDNAWHWTKPGFTALVILCLVFGSCGLMVLALLVYWLSLFDNPLNPTNVSSEETPSWETLGIGFALFVELCGLLASSIGAFPFRVDDQAASFLVAIAMMFTAWILLAITVIGCFVYGVLWIKKSLL